jgi:hypothetical protein
VEAALSAYLASVFAGQVEVLGLHPLGGPDAEGRDPKGFGYGVPFDVMPPFLAFRALVIGHPRWYPSLASGTREALFGFARALMAGGSITAGSVPELLGGIA